MWVGNSDKGRPLLNSKFGVFTSPLRWSAIPDARRLFPRSGLRKSLSPSISSTFAMCWQGTATGNWTREEMLETGAKGEARVLEAWERSGGWGGRGAEDAGLLYVVLDETCQCWRRGQGERRCLRRRVSPWGSWPLRRRWWGKEKWVSRNIFWSLQVVLLDIGALVTVDFEASTELETMGLCVRCGILPLYLPSNISTIALQLCTSDLVFTFSDKDEMANCLKWVLLVELVNSSYYSMNLSRLI